MTPEQTVRRIGRRFIQWWTPLRIAGIALLMLAFLVGTLGYFNERELLYLTETAKQILKYLSANVSTELASIAITMLFVDALYEHRETEREKKRLILQMGSPDNAFAREAVRALRAREWLQKGAAKKAILWDADLTGAYLAWANLQGAHFANAKVQDADLWKADLRDAILENTDFKGACLEDANLKGATVVDVNFEKAHLEGANLQGTYLEGINWWVTKYNNATTWPEGFTPPPEAVNVDAEANVED